MTTDYKLGKLVKKVQDRDEQWVKRLRIKLTELRVPAEEWTYIVRLFVRAERVAYLQGRFADHRQEVRIEPINSIAFPWSWPWDEWKAKGQRLD